VTIAVKYSIFILV